MNAINMELETCSCAVTQGGEDKVLLKFRGGVPSLILGTALLMVVGDTSVKAHYF